MSKKKKKKKKSSYYDSSVISDSELRYMLSGVDKTTDKSYNSLLDEIKTYQLDIKVADADAEKKRVEAEKELRKKLKKKHGVISYYCRKEQVEACIEARKKVLQEMEAKKTFDRIELAFKNIVKNVIEIAKLVVALVTSILSLKTSMGYINPTTLNRLNVIKCMASAIS